MTDLSVPSGIWLFGAGLLAGVVNAIAGGGTLFTFPALLASGLPPLVAAASNAVALWPAHASAAFGARQSLFGSPLSRGQWTLVCAIGILGGAAGAMLLQSVGNEAFAKLIPGLIAMATLIFGLGPRLARPASPHTSSRSVWFTSTLVVSIYGGFFGAGLGVMLMAMLLMLGVRGAQENNAAKNLVATAITSSSLLWMIASGLVAWTPTVVVLAGTVTGGVAGAALAQRIDPLALRRSVVVVGSLLTGYYAFIYWVV